MNFYRQFEELFRGSQDDVKARLQVYTPFIEALKKIYPSPTSIDLGCGRGEFVELLSEFAFDAQGVDIDDDMLEASRQKGLMVYTCDALTFLRTLPADSKALISGIHVAEHISFDDLKALVKEALRVLQPAGLLILETPNPENLIVGTESFYLDPTHQRPLPPDLLAFLPQHYGYHRVKILRLGGIEMAAKNIELSLMEVFNGVSPDFAIVAQKHGPEKLITLMDQAFKIETGTKLNQLANTYEQQSLDRAECLKHELNTVHIHREEINKQLNVLSDIKTQWKEELNKQANSVNIVADQLRIELSQELKALKEETAQLNDKLHINVLSDIKTQWKEELNKQANSVNIVADQLRIELLKELKALKEETAQLNDKLHKAINFVRDIAAQLRTEMSNNLNISRGEAAYLKEAIGQEINTLKEAMTYLKEEIVKDLNISREETLKLKNELIRDIRTARNNQEKQRQELQGVYQSISWRLTYPLRRGNQLVSILMMKVISFYKNRPSLRVHTKKYLSKFPFLFNILRKTYLKNFALNHGNNILVRDVDKNNINCINKSRDFQGLHENRSDIHTIFTDEQISKVAALIQSGNRQ